MSVKEKNNLRTWIEIDKSAVRKNYNLFRKIIDKSLFLGVVKSNAYGHSLVDFSKLLESLGVDFLGVDSIVEANSLREEKIKKPILVLGYTLPSRLKEAVSDRISITISDFESLKNIKKHKSTLKGLKVHIKVDTGMHRQGFFVSELPRLIKELKGIKEIKVEGLYTHFSGAKDPKDPKETNRQIEEFQKSVKIFEDAGYKNIIKHAGATAGVMIFPDSSFDMARVGIGLYGMWPSKNIEEFFGKKISLEPVLSWKTIVSQIKSVKKGDGIGYDLSEKVKRDSKTAVLPIGYWHGFPRSLSGKGCVLIKGKKAKVLGRVSMDMVVVDITDIKNVKVGDEVVIIGKSGDLEITARNTAYLDETTEYEIITRLNPLIKRIFI